MQAGLERESLFLMARFGNMRERSFCLERMMKLIPEDGATVDLRPLLWRLVSWSDFACLVILRYLDRRIRRRSWQVKLMVPFL